MAGKVTKKNVLEVLVGSLSAVVVALLGFYVLPGPSGPTPPRPPKIPDTGFVRDYVDSLRSAVPLDKVQYPASSDGNLTIELSNFSEREPAMDVRVAVDRKVVTHIVMLSSALVTTAWLHKHLAIRLQVAPGEHTVFVSSRSAGVVALRRVMVSAPRWVIVQYYHFTDEPQWSHGSFGVSVEDRERMWVD